MANETITLKQVLDWMDAGQPFSLLAITCSFDKRTGGEELYVAKAWKHQLNPTQSRVLEAAQPQEQRVKRNPNHFENSTRNIKLPNGEIRKVHIRLIRQFNNKTVL